MRPLSKIAPGWWDYTTLDREILDDAARLKADDLLGLQDRICAFARWPTKRPRAEPGIIWQHRSPHDRLLARRAVGVGGAGALGAGRW